MLFRASSHSAVRAMVQRRRRQQAPSRAVASCPRQAPSVRVVEAKEGASGLNMQLHFAELWKCGLREKHPLDGLCWKLSQSKRALETLRLELVHAENGHDTVWFQQALARWLPQAVKLQAMLQKDTESAELQAANVGQQDYADLRQATEGKDTRRRSTVLRQLPRRAPTHNDAARRYTLV